jgi:uncharacterized protein
MSSGLKSFTAAMTRHLGRRCPPARKLRCNYQQLDQVCQVIEEVSFRGVGEQQRPSTLEGKIVQDADRLDALGAIGIARVFAYGGFRHQPMHLPGKVPVLHADFSAYKSADTTTINHFHEKLLLLPSS